MAKFLFLIYNLLVSFFLFFVMVIDLLRKMVVKSLTMKKMAFLVIALLGSGQIALAQSSSDFGIWMDAGVEKKLNKHWTLEGELGARTRNNSKEMDRYNLGVGTDYKLNKYLKF